MNPPYLSLTANQAFQLPCAKKYSWLLALTLPLKLRLRHEGKCSFPEKIHFCFCLLEKTFEKLYLYLCDISLRSVKCCESDQTKA